MVIYQGSHVLPVVRSTTQASPLRRASQPWFHLDVEAPRAMRCGIPLFPVETTRG